MRHYNRRNHIYIDDLMRTAFFSECNRRELRAIASRCTSIRVPAGRVLVRQDEPGFECFVVVDGQAIVERNGMIVAHVSDGTLLGEIALLRGTLRSATVTALTDMDLLVFSASEFGDLRVLGLAPAARGDIDHLVDQRLKIIDGTPGLPVTAGAVENRQAVLVDR